MQWMTLFRKELLENWTNKKWIWVPLVMILLAIMDPLSFYYLPEIIELTGGLPEGAVLDFPTLAPYEVILVTLEQFSMFGVLIIALISMGTIANEKNSGITEIILVKPVRHAHYVTSKWTAYLLMIWLSLWIAMITNWYYTNLLFGDISFATVMQIVFFYGLWLTFVLTLSIFYNTLFKSAGLVAACTVITLVAMSGINMMLGHKLTMFPNQLTSHIAELLVTNTITTELIGTSLILGIIILMLLFSSIFIFKRKEFV